MRISRFEHASKIRAGFFLDDTVLPVAAAAKVYSDSTHSPVDLPEVDDILAYLPPDGRYAAAARDVYAWLRANPGAAGREALKVRDVALLTPVPRPPKLLLLAGNYADHLREGGSIAVERSKTFPYVFSKPLTTLSYSGAAVRLPKVSPDHIDWEVELGVVLGKRARHVNESEALGFVAGYTVVNDISDRRFTPNPQRVARERDKFHDWLHGKWHDDFCPVGPCVLAAGAGVDPQKLHLTLKLNGQIKQDASTAQQIFPVAAVVAFISSIVTLEPGDIISTGTPAGVGNATGTFLRPGDRLEAAIDGIGVLENRMVPE